MAGTGSVEELIILSFGLSALMGVAFLWLSLKDEKTSNTLRVGLMQMGLLFMVNSLIFIIYYLRADTDLFGFSPEVTKYLLSISSVLNLFTMIQIGILFTVFPIPIMAERKNTIRLGSMLVAMMCVSLLLSNYKFGGNTGIYLAYNIGAVTAIGISALVTARWYLLYRTDDDPKYRNVAISSAFLFFAFIGSSIMLWPYTLFFDRRELFTGSFLEGGMLSETLVHLMLVLNGPLVTITLFAIVIKEGITNRDKRDYTVIGLALAYLLFGLANYLVQLLVPVDGEFASLWNYFVVTGTFGLIRPLILIIVALRFNLFDLTNEKVRKRTRVIALLIITVWASAFFEIIQAFIPMPQLLSAALIGVFLAFAIGWEDRIFENLADRADEKILPVSEGYFEDEDPYRLMMLTFAVVVLTFGLGILVGGNI
ncbi:MAG: hypothetical protein OSB30_00400 [Candidatus Poseidoniaceae archaeon]|nr:hypothetical protein [Candidatus Poseidoniaceae archaeon]